MAAGINTAAAAASTTPSGPRRCGRFTWKLSGGAVALGCNRCAPAPVAMVPRASPTGGLRLSSAAFGSGVFRRRPPPTTCNGLWLEKLWWAALTLP